MTHQPLWVILCYLPEKERREIEEIVEKMKERDKGERKMNESEETRNKHSPSTLTCCKDSRPCPAVSQNQLDALVTEDARHRSGHLNLFRRTRVNT